jgi:AraC-like DNA-binding protein
MPQELLRANICALRAIDGKLQPLQRLNLPQAVFGDTQIAAQEQMELDVAIQAIMLCRAQLQEEAHYFDQGQAVGKGNPWLFWMSTLHCETWGEMLQKQCELGEQMGYVHKQIVSELSDHILMGFKRHNFETLLSPYLLQLTDLCQLLLFYRVNSWFLEELIPVEKIYLMDSDHGCSAYCDVLFNVPVEFEHSFFALQHKAKYLRYAIKRSPEDVEKLCRQPGECFAGTPRSRHDHTAESLRRLVDQQPGLSLQQAADYLHCSKDTVLRRLQDSGLRFQQLKDQQRRQAAQDMLLNSTHSIENISALLAYSNPPAFTRAFKSWAGLTPSQFRSQNR